MIETVWFVLLFAMLATYVVMGGADLGVGIVHFLVGRDDQERWQIVRSIRPVWKPNEVWLVASGGTMFLAFPTALATSFSGFYLPLMIVLWLLVFRALGVELRYQIPDRLWSQACDVALSVSSILLTFCLGAALGNIVRGVPLNAEGLFFEPLWTNFLVGDETGILDWYTVLVGLTAVAALAHHGSSWLVAWTDGAVHARAKLWSTRFWTATLGSMAATTACTFAVQPTIWESLAARPWAAIFPTVGIGSLVACQWLRAKRLFRWGLLASALALYGMFATVAASIYPNIVPARNPELSLSIAEAAAPAFSLQIGLAWWIPGILLVIGYFCFVYSRMPQVFSLDESND